MKAAIFVPVLLAVFLAVKAASGKKQTLTYWKLLLNGLLDSKSYQHLAFLFSMKRFPRVAYCRVQLVG